MKASPLPRMPAIITEAHGRFWQVFQAEVDGQEHQRDLVEVAGHGNHMGLKLGAQGVQHDSVECREDARKHTKTDAQLASLPR